MDGATLFLSYNSVDRTSVLAVQKLLAARGITTFLDRDQLAPGLPWPSALEEGLRSVRAVAVFIGRELGGWQKREMWFALDRQVREEKHGRPFPVIPVLLAGADFYSQIITLDRELSDRLAPAQVNIGALTPEELRESIAEPAKLVGLAFEPGLVERILHDVGSEPGNLPLLEFALTGLWSKRKGRILTNAAYDEIGGVTGALAQRAEAEFARFAPEEQTAVRRLLSRLVRVARPEEGTEDTRQRIELQATDPLAEKVALALAGPEVRLLVMGRREAKEQKGHQTVEVAHEALIRNWSRLRGWLNEDREFLLWRQRTQVHVEEWHQHGRDASFLLHGVSLAEADRWQVGRPQDLTAAEQQYISVGVAAARAGARS